MTVIKGGTKRRFSSVSIMETPVAFGFMGRLELMVSALRPVNGEALNARTVQIIISLIPAERHHTGIF